MKVRAIAITQPLIQVDGKNLTADELIGYIARVSNPNNQSNLDTIPKLLNYCSKNGHWSVFEQADLTLEITTSRAISPQILRHKSFCFQEFSQRYAKALEVEYYEARKQDNKNRQNSIDDLDEKVKELFRNYQIQIWEAANEKYEELLKLGVAKECARMILPLNTKTVLYMKGNLRSWIHYIDLRSGNGTQKEHREIALAAKKIFIEHYPIVSKALEWSKE